NIQWTQNQNELLIVHNKYPPKILCKETNDSWILKDWKISFATENATQIPFAKFNNLQNIIFSISKLDDDYILHSNVDIFNQDYVGVHFKINSGIIRITSVIDGKNAAITIIKNLENFNPTSSIFEQAFSSIRGYPKAITFYQNRLIIGGSFALPSRIWMSKIGDYFNFDLGSGLDDEAIEFDILSDKQEIIQTIFSGKHLQVFTSDSEWVITSYPMTPANVQLKKQTEIGSITTRYVPPKFIEGSTMFIAKNGVEIREFLFGEIEQTYSSFDLAILSKHLMCFPVDQEYDITKKTLYIPMKDGSMAVLTLNKDYGLRAWCKWTTDGEFISVAIVNGKLYSIIKRNEKYFLEMFNADANSDCSVVIKNADKIERVNVAHLKGKHVYVIEDDAIYPLQQISKNEYHPQNEDVQNIEIGLPFMHTYAPLPLMFNRNIQPKKVRLISANFRIINTKFLSIDTGHGLRNISLDNYNNKDFFENFEKGKAVDIEVKSFGWNKNFTVPVFKIQSTQPSKVQIISIQCSYLTDSV
ncbi:MAG: hypothetical protein LBU68_02910, partial [Rickettsiales bacterium]|nr:hypothetical protein [Rickettsiales bacterium]